LSRRIGESDGGKKIGKDEKGQESPKIFAALTGELSAQKTESEDQAALQVVRENKPTQSPHIPISF
jgi:hypothetical protein